MHASVRRHATALGSLGLLAACGGSSAPLASPQATPSPASVTQDNPGGDSEDPSKSALLRLVTEPLGPRTDKFGTLRAAFPDWQNWRRVRFLGYPTRAAFRYGDEHYAIGALFYSKAEPGDTPESCLERFERHARSVAKTFSLELAPTRGEQGQCYPRVSVLEPQPKPPQAPPGRRPSQRQVPKPMPVIRTLASFATLAERGHWYVAAAAYPSWPGTCLVQGLAVDGEKHPELAEAVVLRWIRDAAGRLVWERALWEAPPIEDR